VLKKLNAVKTRVVLTRVVLVRPLHELNVGSVARVMKNFGLKKLFLVAPRCKPGFAARLFAKHSHEILQTAVTCSSLKQAVRGCDFVIGTTGVPSRFRSRVFKNCLSIEEALKKALNFNSVALVFGPEDVGLSEKDFEECNVVAVIPTSSAHSVLNLSHAVAVALYELFLLTQAREERGQPRFFFKPALDKKISLLVELFSETLECLPRVRDKKKVSLALKRVLERAPASDDEVQALFAAFGELHRKLKARKLEVGKKVRKAR